MVRFIFLPRLQPEFVKPFFIIVLSLIITNEKYSNFSLKFSISLLLTLLIGSLLLIQPDLGQTLIIGLNWIILIFISGVNLIFLSSVSLIGITLLLYIAFFIPKFEYIKNRILSF